MIVYILGLYTCCIAFFLLFFFLLYTAARIWRSSLALEQGSLGAVRWVTKKETRTRSTARLLNEAKAGKAFWSLGGSLESKGRFSEGHV